jgi:hypothetical protein
MNTDPGFVAQLIAAIGTVSVAILAIWGDWFKARFAGPKIPLTLRDERGNLTRRENGARTVYYHVSVTNTRKWSPARNIRIMLTAIHTKAADGNFVPDRLVHALQLTWAHPEFHEISPTLSDRDIADFGFLDEGASEFTPSLYVRPLDFPGLVAANQSKRFTIVATADNYNSPKPLIIEVSWNGKWIKDTEELMKHLVVREVG